MRNAPWVFRFLMISLSGWVVGAGLAAGEMPARVQLATVEEVQVALAERPVVLIDARRHLDYRLEHLPQAINVPWDRLSFEGSSWEEWKARPEVLLVVYCRSKKCEDAEVVADALVQRGFRRVWVMKGGLQRWKELGGETQGI